jgi:hypothetical protein
MPELLETIEDGVATLTFNRPERMNALSTPIMQGLLDGLPRLAGDPAVKVVSSPAPAAPSAPAPTSRPAARPSIIARAVSHRKGRGATAAARWACAFSRAGSR